MVGCPDGTPPTLVTVTATVVLDVPSTTGPKATLCGVSSNFGAPTPVPVSATFTLPAGSPVIVSAALRAPEVVGANRTEIVQVAFGFKIPGQLVLKENDAASPPV